MKVFFLYIINFIIIVQLLKDFLEIVNKCEDSQWSFTLINSIFDQLSAKQYTKPAIYHALRKSLMNGRKGAVLNIFYTFFIECNSIIKCYW